jgi:hypothetical protein
VIHTTYDYDTDTCIPWDVECHRAPAFVIHHEGPDDECVDIPVCHVHALDNLERSTMESRGARTYMTTRE